MVEEPALGFALPCLSQLNSTENHAASNQLVLKQLSLKSEEELGMLLDAYSGQFGCSTNNSQPMAPGTS